MEPSSIPLELISFRGLLKSAEDIARGMNLKYKIFKSSIIK